MTETYRAIYELDTKKWWFVHIDEIPGCHTHGGNLAAARRNIFEAAAALLDVDESELVIEDDCGYQSSWAKQSRLPEHGGPKPTKSVVRRKRQPTRRYARSAAAVWGLAPGTGAI